MNKTINPVEEPIAGTVAQGRRLSVRLGPSTSNARIGIVEGGTEIDILEVIEENGNTWARYKKDVYSAIEHNGTTYIVIDGEPPVELPPYTDEIVIPEPAAGWGYYQLNHDNPPRQGTFTESVDKHTPMPETVPMTKRELWTKVPPKWVQFQRDLARLDSPNRTPEQHEAAFLDLIAPHRAFTDLKGHYEDENNYHWKVSLSTGGNIVYGWRSGTYLYVKCLDMREDPPRAEEVYNDFTVTHRATQIHPKIEYLFDAEGNHIGDRRNKLPDGTFRVTHFPQGENCTSFPLMYPAKELLIPDWRIARKLSAGDVVKVVNLASDQ